MELVTAARRHCLQVDTLRGYCGEKMFRWRLEEPIEGTSGAAIVIFLNPAWKTPDPVQSIQRPVMVIDCYADPTRESGDARVIKTQDAEDKAMAMARALEPVFHHRRAEVWGAFGSTKGLQIVSCGRGAEPRIITAGDRHAAEPKLGDTVICRTTWNVEYVQGVMP
jgi:hypothetical protein